MATLSNFQHENPQAVFDLLERHLSLKGDSLVSLTQKFLDEFKTGLANYSQPMGMIPSFVQGVPDGTETGSFLALDLGGTNLRVCEVVLNGDQTFNLVQQKYRVSDSLKTGEATALFNYLADSVDAFLTTHATTGYASPGDSPRAAANRKIVHLGFTFSFPVEQSAIDSGKLLTWTKGFNVKNVVGQDVVKLLQDAFDRKHMNVKCVALVNDTVGTLLSRSYTAGGCVSGCIFGTGTNGAYVEQVANIPKLKGTPVYEKGGQMIINCEWGAFNNSRSHLLSTPYDNALDRLSLNPKSQAFEKFISGMYLGDLVRQILVALIDAAPKPLLFSGHSSPVLNKQYGFDTSIMSAVEEVWIGDYSSQDAFVHPAFTADFKQEELSPKVVSKLEHIRQIIVQQVGVREAFVSLRDAAIVRWVCALVARRAALLSGVAISVVLIQQGYASLVGENKPIRNQNDQIRIGVDGSLVEHYPNFLKTLRESLRKLVGEDVESRVDIGLAKDGSGVGAALCALVAVKHG